MLTLKKLKKMAPDTIFASGIGFIEHPWFNQATKTIEADGKSTKVKWVAIRGYIHDWAIYHSLDANLEPANNLDGTSHLNADFQTIADHGAKLHNREIVKKLVPCSKLALKFYRD